MKLKDAKITGDVTWTEGSIVMNFYKIENGKLKENVMSNVICEILATVPEMKFDEATRHRAILHAKNIQLNHLETMRQKLREAGITWLEDQEVKDE